jgi:hypothetical protein
MNRNSDYVSEQWLRAHAYERGKESQEEDPFGSQCVAHLAEARVMLRYRWNRWRIDLQDSEK